MRIICTQAVMHNSASVPLLAVGHASPCVTHARAVGYLPQSGVDLRLRNIHWALPILSSKTIQALLIKLHNNLVINILLQHYFASPSCCIPSATLNTCKIYGNKASIVSSAPLVEPGKVIINMLPIKPATPRDNMAKGIRC